MHRADVPDVVVRRLPLYFRALTYLAEQGRGVVSSDELGVLVGVSAAQIRKDLSFFGEFGRQGLGYEVSYLRDELRRILQVDQQWHLLIVGAGALGHALASYRTFQRWNYEIVAVFDNDVHKIGQPIGDLTIQPMEELAETVRAKHVEIAILAVPAEEAQEVAEELVRVDLRAVLNYAPINLVLPQSVHVANIDPITSLQSITYYL